MKLRQVTSLIVGTLMSLAVGGMSAECQAQQGPGSGAPGTVDPVEVKVGGYEFEPFVEGNSGITPAFIALLNGAQKKYQFVFVPIPAQRRYELIERGSIDAVFFEMPRWGWQRFRGDVAFTQPILTASEIFFALADNPAGMAIFDQITQKKLALTLGYHYAFADFNSDQAYIRARFNVVFGKSQRVALRHLLAGSADMAILSDIFVRGEIKKDPALTGRFLQAHKADQEYALPLMVAAQSALSEQELAQLVTTLRTDRKLHSFFRSFGVEELMAPALPR